MLSNFKYYNWRPTIGDPTFMGWFTVFAYFIAALLCGIYTYRLFRQTEIEISKRERLFWLGLSLLMVFLGINKQLDLQSLFTEIVRIRAWHHGWYEQRRIYQKEFILAITAGSAFFIIVLFIILRRHLKKYGLALFGFIVLITFIIVRAASFHHVDMLLNERMYGVRINWILELSGISIIALAALIKLYSKRKYKFQHVRNYLTTLRPQKSVE